MTGTTNEETTTVSHGALALCVTSVFFGLGDVMGVFWGAGLFSVGADIRAVAAGIPAVDVDPTGLCTVFVAACAALICGAAALIGLDPSRSPTGMIIVLTIAFSGVVINTLLGAELVGRYMTDHGYARCPARDHTVEPRNIGAVRIEGYVRDPQSCA